MAREQQISRLFVDLADTLVRGYDVVDLIQRLVDGVQAVLDVDAAGVLLAERPDRLSVTAASSDDMETLELFEVQSRTGPCYAAFERGEPVSLPDLDEARDDWPDFIDRAVQLGYRSGYAFPLRLRNDTIGALDVFWREVRALTDDDLALGQALADMAAIGILQERAVSDAEVRAEQLQYALHSRVLIEQAKGMLAERLEIRPADAFDRMRACSRSTNTRLREICRRVVDEGFVPD